MTDQELKEFIASIGALQRDNERLFAEERRKTEEQRRKNDEEFNAFKMKNDEEFNAFKMKNEAELKELRAKNEAELKEMRARADEDRRKTEEDRRETERVMRELGIQIGGLGNKFGSFTEGLALPSVQRLLAERFGVEDFMKLRRKRMGAETIELDALGIVNGSRNEAYIVEVKSNLRSEAIKQMMGILEKFRRIFPEYATMKLYGVIAAAEASTEALQEAQQAGFYAVTFENDLMQFHDENGFMPKAY
jgi:hypothetical protein